MSNTKIIQTRERKERVPAAVQNFWKINKEHGDGMVIEQVKGISRREQSDAINLGIATNTVKEALTDFFQNAAKYRSDYYSQHKQAS